MKILRIALFCVLATALTTTSPQQTAAGARNSEVVQRVLAAGTSSAPVTVGTLGNEPVIAVAPDGTLYISALQHIYRSTDGGATWTNLPRPIETAQLTLA